MAGPDHEDAEVLELLDDDSVVAQQTSAHAPQKRASVSDAPGTSVVVADEGAPAAGRALPSYGSWNEETVVVRGRRRGARSKPKRRSWGTIAIWVLAGAAAFALGGVLALLDGSDAQPTASEPAAAPDPEPSAVPAAATPEEPAAETDEAPDDDTATLSDLPVETEPAAVAPNPKRVGRPSVPKPKPAAAPAPKPAPAPAKTAPRKTEIPSGI